jgi:hypothetical protein
MGKQKMISTIKALTVDMELLNKQIVLTSGAIASSKTEVTKEYLGGVLELLISLEESLKANDVAVITKKE